MPKLRRLVVDGKRYLWRIEVAYLRDSQGDFNARTTCVAYLEGQKSSPGRISFVTLADAQAGAPLCSGYAFETRSGSVMRGNLNEPKHAAATIRLLLRLGWDPENGSVFQVEDANHQYLSELLTADAKATSTPTRST